MNRQQRLFKTTTVTLDIPGDNRQIAPDVLFLHLSRALAGQVMSNGRVVILTDDSGAVFVNDELIYERKERVR